MSRTCLIFLFCLLSFPPLRAQEGNGDLLFRGYLSNMQSVMFQQLHERWYLDNLLHNRLQLKWYAGDHLTTNVEVRNRFFFGNSLDIPGYKEYFSFDRGWTDLSFTLASGESYILETTVDRAWLDLQFGNLEIRAGRQRINWGKTLVWNPNDIFNAYSFFDFDYVEKPGCDALRVRYATGASTDVEASIKVDRDDQVTAAAILRLNPGMYDLQFFGGILNGKDYVAGTGWSGNLKGAGFNGELTFFQPTDSSFGKGDLMLSVGGEYTFRNSLSLQAEYLYSSVDYQYHSFAEFYYLPLTVKQITFTDHNLFVQASYPFTPLFTGTMAVIWYPSIHGYFLGPSLNLSLQEDLDLSFYLQHFCGEFNKAFGRQKLTLAFLRLKWSF